MFSNQNQANSNDSESKTDFTIRTMKSDLAKLAPDADIKMTDVPQNESIEPAQQAPSSATFERISDANETSPFLNEKFSTPNMDVMPERKPRADMYGPQMTSPLENAPDKKDSQQLDNQNFQVEVFEPKPFPQNYFEAQPQQTLENEASLKSEDSNPFLDEDTIIKNDEKAPSRLNWGTVLIATLSLLIVIALGIGGYYFWMTRDNEQPVTLIPEQPLPEPQPKPTPEPEPSPNALSLKNSNPLLIDPDIDSPESIQKLLKALGEQIQDQQIATPVEFIPVDSKKGPLSFAIFSSIFGLKLPSDIISHLGENYSLFIYDDSGATRVILSVETLGNDTMKPLRSKETTLVANLEPLLIGEIIEFRGKPFADGVYDNYSIRFVNLNSENTLSIDYTIANEQLIIGTSKNSIRAVLDKLNADTE